MISLCPKTAPDAHQLKNARQHDAFRRLREISVRVLVLAVVERFVGLRLRRPIEQEAEVGSDERVWCRDRVGVVHGSVLPRERDVAGILAQAVLELGADLAGPELEPARRVLHHLLELGGLLGLFLGEGKPEVEREVGAVGRHVRELPAHPLLVGRQPVDRRAREADQVHIALIHVKQQPFEPVGEVRAPGASSYLKVRAVHDVVGEKLRAAFEQLGELLLAVLGVELVFLLHRYPGQLAPLPLDFLVALSLLRLELGELVARRLPFLAGSDLVFSHLRSSYRLDDSGHRAGSLEATASPVRPPDGGRVIAGRGSAAKMAKGPAERDCLQYRPQSAPGARPDASWSPWRLAVPGATVAALTTASPGWTRCWTLSRCAAASL